MTRASQFDPKVKLVAPSILLAMLALIVCGVSFLGPLRFVLGSVAFVLAGAGLFLATRAGQISRATIFWYAFALAGGLCSLVLPAYLPGTSIKQPAYGWPLIPWLAFAWSNIRPILSAGCFLAVGFALAFSPRRRGVLLPFLAAAFPAALLTANTFHDWAHDPTSHNLWPFEVLIYAFISASVLVGAGLGWLVVRWRRNTPSTITSTSL